MISASVSILGFFDFVSYSSEKGKAVLAWGQTFGPEQELHTFLG
jgi:hypothetical protein